MPTRASLACALALVFAAAALAQSPGKKLPRPDDEKVAEAKKLVGELYRDDYAKAKTPEQKLALADKLMKDASETKNDDAGKYALFLVAREIAVIAGDWDASIAAAEQQSRTFNVAFLEIVDEVRAKFDTAGTVPANPRSAFITIMGLVDKAIAQDEYELAERLSVSAQKLTRRAGDARTTKELEERITQLQKRKREFADVKLALAKLANSPADPEANLQVGKFRCLVQERWEEGLPMLALGSDGALAKAAAPELLQPTAATDLLSIADAWWSLAESAKEYSSELRRHAVDGYLRVLPKLEGLPRKKAESRIESAEKWLSKEATYTVSSIDKDWRPLPSLLNATERFHEGGGTQFAFSIAQPDAYIVIDLKREVPVSRIHIQNRPVADRTTGSTLYLSKNSDVRGTLVWTAPNNAAEWTIVLPRLQTARYITIARDPNRGDAFLHLRKVKVFGPE
jgi:hypothetical protein